MSNPLSPEAERKSDLSSFQNIVWLMKIAGTQVSMPSTCLACRHSRVVGAPGAPVVSCARNLDMKAVAKREATASEGVLLKIICGDFLSNIRPSDASVSKKRHFSS